MERGGDGEGRELESVLSLSLSPSCQLYKGGGSEELGADNRQCV